MATFSLKIFESSVNHELSEGHYQASLRGDPSILDNLVKCGELLHIKTFQYQRDKNKH